MAIFVGRERENVALDESLEAARKGEGQLVLLSGEPGIGKTRLAEELTRRAEASGFRSAWGRAWEGEGTPAHFPWIQIVRRLRPIFETLFDTTRAVTPELGALVGSPSAGRAARSEAEVNPAEARFRMFDGVAEFLRLASAESPLLLVLDDLHAADISTLELLRFVARSTRNNAHLLLLGTMRDAAPASPSRRLLAEMAREATPRPIARLPREAVASWVAHVAPELSPHVDRLASVSEGNPLFVGELLAAAWKQPGHRWSSAHELPLGVREAIRAHVATLSIRAQEALAHAAIFGREFPLGALGEDALPLVEEALEAGVLVSVGDGEHAPSEARFRFTHVLIRDELYASLPSERRAELHRQAATHEPDPAHAVPHWIAGGRVEDAAAIFAAVTAAMADALARFAFDDAALIAEHALRTDTLALREACELRIAAGEAWALAGKLDAARAAGAEAAQEARQLNASVLLARAALVFATEVVLSPGRDEAAVALLRSAASELDGIDSPMRARVLARLSLALLPAPPNEHDAALRLAEDALAMARRLGDDDTLFTVLALTRRTPSETDAPDKRFALNAETIALAKKLGRAHEIASLFSWQVAECIQLGDIDAAARELETLETSLASYAQPHYRYQGKLARALLADLEGRFSEADALNREVLELSDHHDIGPGKLLALVQRIGFMYTRAGATAGWIEVEAKFKPLLSGGLLADIYRSMADAPCGRIESVRESLALTSGIPLEALPDGGGLAAPCAIAKIVEQAPRFYEFLGRDEILRGPWQFGPGRVTSMGPRALTLGRLAMLLGKSDEAVRHFTRALAIVERLRCRPFVAQTHLELARALASRDHAQAALSIAREIGLASVEAEAQLLASDAAFPSDRKPQSSSPPADTIALERDGETWSLVRGDKRIVLKDTKGLAYLQALLESPCREIHALELVGQHAEGDAGPVLDQRAKHAYRERAEALREELEEATRNADTGRAEQMREELDALANELARAVGIGGRDRRAVSPSERARINVQRRIRDVITRVRAIDPRLADDLQLSVRTGMFCVYLPLSRR